MPERRVLHETRQVSKTRRTNNGGHLHIDRRHFLGLSAAAAAGCASHSGQPRPAQQATVRDRLWAFCNPVNADYYMVKKRSVMTPVESALYLGIPNIIMVNQFPHQELPPEDDGFFQPWRSPLDLHAYPTRMLRQVVWSIVGARGKTDVSERDEVIALAKRTPNFVGVMMDDFVRPGGHLGLSIEQLQEIRTALKSGDKPLDLWVTLYMASSGHKDQIKPGITSYLRYIDVATLWAWDHEDLPLIEAQVSALEQISPQTRKMLGCYTAALNPKGDPRWTPLSVEAMRYQCETGLSLLQQGRIEGIIIYANFLDLDWECMSWVRDWIRRVGDQPLGRSK